MTLKRHLLSSGRCHQHTWREVRPCNASNSAKPRLASRTVVSLSSSAGSRTKALCGESRARDPLTSDFRGGRQLRVVAAIDHVPFGLGVWRRGLDNNVTSPSRKQVSNRTHVHSPWLTQQARRHSCTSIPRKRTSFKRHPLRYVTSHYFYLLNFSFHFYHFYFFLPFTSYLFNLLTSFTSLSLTSITSFTS